MSTFIMWIIDLGKAKTRPWRHIYHDIGIPRSKSHDTEIPRPKNHDIEKQRPTTSWFQGIFSEDEKPRHRDSKTEKPRHQDSKTKKPRHQVSAEFWPLCPLIDHPLEYSRSTNVTPTEHPGTTEANKMKNNYCVFKEI